MDGQVRGESLCNDPCYRLTRRPDGSAAPRQRVFAFTIKLSMSFTRYNLIDIVEDNVDLWYFLYTNNNNNNDNNIHLSFIEGNITKVKQSVIDTPEPA